MFFLLLLADAHLLTVKNTEENDFVSRYLHEDPLITSQVWLGMDFDGQGNPIPWNRKFYIAYLYKIDILRGQRNIVCCWLWAWWQSSPFPLLDAFALFSDKPVSWQDGSTLEFSNWKSGAFTTEKNSGPQCAVMITGDNGSWKLVTCKDSYSRVVCKTAASK